MAGILDLDPQTQGLLAAAFAGLKASGPSPTPVSLGQVVGAAGEAGLQTTAAAKKAAQDAEAKDLAIQKAKLDLALDQEFQSGGGILGKGMSDPDTMEALGTRLSLRGHQGGPALIAQAQKLRAKQNAEKTLATMKSQPAVQPDPQEVEQAADQGTPAPAAKPAKGGLFASLIDSPVPQIAAQAKAAQASLDAQTDAQSVTPQHWLDIQKALATQEATITNRAPNVHPVKDKSSSTGWSYADLAKGGAIVAKDAPPPAAAVQQQAAGMFSPDTIDQMAQRYRLDGTLPPAGMGASGNIVRAKILNRAAEMAKADGQSGEAERIRQSGYKANTQALGQLEKQRNLVLAFEKNALANADLALQQSEKVDRVGSPAIDRWIQAGKKEVLGDVEVAKLHTAIRTFVNEYAKVTTSVTGGGVTSDSARKEIDDLLRAAQTKEQVRGVIGLMKQEMKNREKSYEQQVSELKQSMKLPEIPKTPGNAPSQSQIDDLLKKYGPKATNG